MSAAQRAVFDRIAAGPRGTVEGPLRVWMHSPKLADLSQELGKFCRYDTSLAPRLSELAIITIGAVWRAGFEWHVHAPIAAKAGIAAEAIEAIRVGNEPILARDDEAVVYAFTHALVADRNVPEAIFRRAQDVLGNVGLVELTGIVGYYSYIAMTIVAFDVENPGDDPFTG